jgi:lysophospholipase L1-like esterase
VALIGTSITGRNNLVVTAPGTGITANTGNIETGLVAWDALGYWHWANLQMGQRFNLIANRGVGGNTTTQMVARFASDILALSPLPAWLVLEPGPNDAGTAAIPAATTIANITAMLTAARTAGIRVILITITPSSYWDATGKASAATVNQWIRTTVRSLFPGVVVRDPAAALTDPTSGGPNVTYFVTEGDGGHVHLSNTGAGLMGSIVATGLTEVLPSIDRLGCDPADPNNLFTNPFLVGGTTTATGITCDRADGGGAITGTPSKVARTDGLPGYWQQVNITANNARFRTDNTAGSPTWVAGADYLYGLMEFQTDNDWTTPHGLAAAIYFLNSGGAIVGRTQALTARSGDGDCAFRPASGVFFMPPMQIPAATTRIRTELDFYLASGAGAGTARMGRLMVRKVGV